MVRRKLYEAIERARGRFQESRADLFVQLLEPTAGMRVLDLGGNRGQFARLLRSRVELEITVADILDFSRECRAEGFPFVLLKDGETLPFSNSEFDAVVCNSVIEHVTLPKAECGRPDLSDGEWIRRAHSAQSAFAVELRRVCRGYFVQTPDPRFPIDVHLWLPLTNRLRHSQLIRFIAVSDKIWVKQGGIPDWELISEDEMRMYFPDGKIHIERALGFPKSLIAYMRPE